MFHLIRHSLITRLMVYFLCVGFLMALIFGVNIALNLKQHFRNEILPNIAQYLVYITNDIGVPPDLTRAQNLSKALSFKVHINGPELNWQSDQEIRSKDRLDFEVAPEPFQQFKIARHHGVNFVLLKQKGYEYIYVIGRPLRSSNFVRNMVVLAILLCLMIVLFVLIKRSLKPIHVIAKGVDNIKLGNLESPIEIQQSHEFVLLAEGINTMAAEIKAMLEAKQQLLLAMSHELRSPITRAQVNCALLPETPVQQAIKRDMLEMEMLISQILQSQQLESSFSILNKTHFALDELIIGIKKMYFEQQPFKLDLVPATIHADQTRITLLIKNLMDNALKYSSERCVEPIMSVSKKGGLIKIRVEDFGIGMEHQELTQISQAFYRIDKARQRSTGGFGLGLYLCQLIVAAHQGEIHFSSEINKGTKVTVLLHL